MIYHITTQEDWDDAQRKGSYSAESLLSEGFIHCSTAEQVTATANRFYADHSELLLLCIDGSSVKSAIVYEAGADLAQERFPHIYGPLNLNAVVSVYNWQTQADGSFATPTIFTK